MTSVRGKIRFIPIPLFALLIFLALSTNLAAPPAARADQANDKTQQFTPALSTDSTPVPVPVPDQKTMDYYCGSIVWWIAEMLLNLAVPLIFLFTGFSAGVRNRAKRLGRNWFGTIAIYYILFILVNFLIDLPMDYFHGFVREHAYGMSDQTLSKWGMDHFKSLLVSMVGGVLFLWIPYLLLWKSPRRWWLYSGLLAIPFLFFVIMISPVFVAPLFNDFHRMENRALEEKILRLADRAGIEGSRVYEVNKSTDTNRLNAYVTGFAGTKRIVLWDTAVANLNEKELMFVMGHEMGHYVLGHIWKLVLFSSGLILLTLFAIHRTADWTIRRYGTRFGFIELHDIASLPLLLLLFNVYGFVMSPVQLAFNRSIEHEADRFGLEITHENHAAGTSFSKFVTRDLVNPRPHFLIKIFRYSHPTLAERIDFANQYRPWEKHEPGHYEHLFKEPSKQERRPGPGGH